MFQHRFYQYHQAAAFYSPVQDDDDIPLSQCCVIDESLFYPRVAKASSPPPSRRPSTSRLVSRRPSQAPSTLLDDLSDDEDDEDLVPIGVVLQHPERKFQSAAEKYKEKVMGALERRHSCEESKRRQLDLMRSSSAGRSCKRISTLASHTEDMPFPHRFLNDKADDFAGTIERAFEDLKRSPYPFPSS